MPPVRFRREKVKDQAQQRCLSRPVVTIQDYEVGLGSIKGPGFDLVRKGAEQILDLYSTYKDPRLRLCLRLQFRFGHGPPSLSQGREMLKAWAGLLVQRALCA